MAMAVSITIRPKKNDTPGYLKRCITYILNSGKTDDGLLVGGNCGRISPEIFQSMIMTKRFFAKEWGVQGYHLVISFDPGDCEADTAYVFAREFCERYLGRDFEYVYAVHTDQPHLHVHIVYNSVSQIRGKKFRFDDKGPETVQNILDDMCIAYGIPVPQRPEKKGYRGNRNYQEKQAEKSGLFSKGDLIRADIDAAVLHAADMENFRRILEERGYSVQDGMSEEYGAYLIFHAPGFRSARSDFHLGEGYKMNEIADRIAHKEKGGRGLAMADRLAEQYGIPILHLKGTTIFQTGFIRRVHQACDWYRLYFQREEQSRVRKDLMKIDRLREECMYLLEEKLGSEEEVRERYLALEEAVRQEVKRIIDSRTPNKREQKRARDIRRRYRELWERLGEKDVTDEEAGLIVDGMRALEKYYPALLSPEKRPVTSARLESLKKERLILKRILKEAPVSAAVREVPRLGYAAPVPREKERVI